MNALGATVPLSPGCFEMCAKSDPRAEESVRGASGIDGPGNAGVLFRLLSDAPRPSFVEGLRSDLLRAVAAGVDDCDVCGTRVIGSEEVEGSGSCKSSSRNGLQKYRA